MVILRVEIRWISTLSEKINTGIIIIFEEYSMLPFARMLEYGNTAPNNWFKGTELIAWDSTNFKQTGFTDYTGKMISVGLGVAGQSGTDLPSKSAQIFKYGSMVYMGKGTHIGTRNNIIPNNVMSSDWCIDFWLKNDGATYGVYPLVSLPDVKIHDSSTMLYIADGSPVGSANIAVNGTTVNSGVKWPVFDGLIHHYCVQYIASTGQWRFYIDGVFQQALTKTIPLTLTRKDICICGITNSYNSYIERYRLRSGLYFTTDTSFDVTKIYD